MGTCIVLTGGEKKEQAHSHDFLSDALFMVDVWVCGLVKLVDFSSNSCFSRYESTQMYMQLLN